MQVDILNEHNPSKSPDNNNSFLVNMYLEENKDKSIATQKDTFGATNKGEYSVMALPTYGLDLLVDTGYTTIRHIYEQTNILYVVADNKLLSITTANVVTVLGTLNTSSGYARIVSITGGSDENNQLCVQDGVNLYCYNIKTGVGQFPITDTTFVSGVLLSNGGKNYVNPVVTITDTTGTGAVASASQQTGIITGISVTTAGSGYSDTPTVTITDAANTGSGAVLSANQVGGVINSISVINPGTGYSSPNVLITDSAGSGATATATLNNGQVIAVTVILGGVNYAAPTATIIDGGSGASATVQTSTNDTPQTSNAITTQDDYIITQQPNSIQFNISNIADTTTWNALNFASKIAQADKLSSIISKGRQLWLLGNKTSEAWQNDGGIANDGTAQFPFSYIPGSLMEYGCGAKNSVVIADNTIFWLAQNRNGGYCVVKIASGYNPQIVSNRGISYRISNFSTVSDAYAYSYYKESHEFYEITFPTAGVTFTYDISTGLWFERTSGTGTLPFLASSACLFNQQTVIGDTNSGKIYIQTASSYTENGTPIKRVFQSTPVYFGGKNIRIDRLQVDVQTVNTPDNLFTVEVSGDRGQTWRTVETYTVQIDGAHRLYTDRLGMERSWVVKISTEMNGYFSILGMQAEAEAMNY